jgi:hypothetical protein
VIIDLTGMKLERSADSVDFADLTTTSGAVKSGPAAWVPGQENQYEIPFTPEAAESERWPITRRIITKDAEEEQLYIDAEQARSNNTTWTAGTQDQIASGAAAIEGTSGNFTTTDASNHIRSLARGVRLLSEQAEVAANQRNAIILLLLRILNKV